MEFFKIFQAEGLQDLIRWGGFAILAAIVFAETGLLAGFFLPGDSLLFTAGMLVGMEVLKPPMFLPQDKGSTILLLNALLMTAAFVGNSTGYWIGRKTGPKLFNRPDSRFFKREHLERTQAFYDKHGGKTIILAEFMPFARTFAPVVAGVAEMPYRKFMSFNALGVVIWISSMTLLGFLLGDFSFNVGGRHFAVRENIDKAIILIVVLSVTPALIHILKARLRARAGTHEEPTAERETRAADPAPTAPRG